MRGGSMGLLWRQINNRPSDVLKIHQSCKSRRKSGVRAKSHPFVAYQRCMREWVKSWHTLKEIKQINLKTELFFVLFVNSWYSLIKGYSEPHVYFWNNLEGEKNEWRWINADEEGALKEGDPARTLYSEMVVPRDKRRTTWSVSKRLT